MTHKLLRITDLPTTRVFLLNFKIDGLRRTCKLEIQVVRVRLVLYVFSFTERITALIAQILLLFLFFMNKYNWVSVVEQNYIKVYEAMTSFFFSLRMNYDKFICKKLA